jgi:uracil-DNA glycosylase
MSQDRIRLENGWKQRLRDQFDQPYMKDLRAYLLQRRQNGASIFPPPDQWFSAFNMTPFDDVKVVILGQDPYHGVGQAHGMCFSVLPGVAIPPSLRNIYKELQSDLGIAPVSHGYLASWAEQGVFLLNSVLTVERGQAAAHQGKGWEQFTDRVIEVLAEQRDGVVFLLWGAYARRKGQMIDQTRHLVLSCAHPSPFSATGFLGCKHFSRANDYLLKSGRTAVNWQLPETPGSV